MAEAGPPSDRVTLLTVDEENEEEDDTAYW